MKNGDFNEIILRNRHWFDIEKEETNKITDKKNGKQNANATKIQNFK